MKKGILIVFISVLALGSVNAQGRYGKTPQDSIKCLEGLSLYHDFMESNPEKSFSYWRVPFTICPSASKSMYINGAIILHSLIKSTDDETRKAEYIDTLMLLYDQRIENFGEKGYVLGKKGFDMTRYIPSKIEEAYKMLAQSIEIKGNESQSSVIQMYVYAATKLEKKGTIEKKDVVDDYMQAINISDYNIKKGNNTEYFKNAKTYINKIASNYLTCDVLINIYKSDFEANKTDPDWLTNAASMLKEKKCADSDIYIKIAETLYDIAPTADAAENMGVVFFQKGNNSKALSYFKKAVTLQEDKEKKADIYYKIALTNYKIGSYTSARSAARKAIKENSHWGKPYILIGDMYVENADKIGDDPCAHGMVYVAAVKEYEKARAADAEASKEANERIATYKKYYPSKKDCFFEGLSEGSSYKVGGWIDTTIKIPAL